MHNHASLAAIVGALFTVTACGGEYHYPSEPTGDEPLFSWQPLEVQPAAFVPRECADADQHFTGDLTLFGQRSTADLGEVSVLEGSLVLTGAADLQGLRCLRRVEGDVVVQGTDTLLDMTAFSSLREVGGSLIVRENTALSSLRGLEQLRRLGDSLIIERNESLLTITELDALGGYLEAVRIRDNDSLHAVHLFASSSASLHVLEVAFNPALERLWGFDGSPHGTRVSGSITVEHNDALERASLPVLSFGDATESIRVQHNAALLLLELVTGKQTWLPGDLLLEDNPSLQRLAGFSSIRQVGGHLHLRGNTSLTTLGAFETLLRIDGDLLVEQSHGLTDVNLGALRVIYGNLVVRSNHGLTSLQGLTSLAALRGDLAIERNPDLDLCDVEVLQRQVQRAAPKTLCGR